MNSVNHHEIWPEDVASDSEILDKTDEQLDKVWSTIAAKKENAFNTSQTLIDAKNRLVRENYDMRRAITSALVAVNDARNLLLMAGNMLRNQLPATANEE